MANRRKTGEPQKARQPFSIDRLPPAVREAIELLRNKFGKTWEQIEAISAEKFDANLVPLGCFVNWDALDTNVLELFPNLRIPKSNLQRWYDVNVQQKREDVLRRSAQARELAEAFADGDVPGSDDAVQNALRDTIMGMLQENTSSLGRDRTAELLLRLAEVQQKSRTNKLRERVVGVAERKIAQLEKDANQRRAKMEAESAKLAKKASKGEVTPADIDRLRERVFGLPPKAHVEVAA
jgi:hypothetical protein